MSDSRGAFFMGNALVVGAVERIGEALLASIRRGEVGTEEQPPIDGVKLELYNLNAGD